MIRWRRIRVKNHDRADWFGYLGRVFVAEIIDHSWPTRPQKEFDLTMRLPPISGRDEGQNGYMTNYYSQYTQLDRAKAQAERQLARWLRAAGLNR